MRVDKSIVCNSLGDGTDQNSNNDTVGVVGWRKLTNMCVLGRLPQFCSDGLLQKARSRSILGVRSSNLAQIEAGAKLHPLQAYLEALEIKIGNFLGP